MNSFKVSLMQIIESDHAEGWCYFCISRSKIARGELRPISQATKLPCACTCHERTD